MDFNDKNTDELDATVNTEDTPKTSLEFEIGEEPGLVFMSEADPTFDEKGGLVFEAEADVTPTEEETPATEEKAPDVFDSIPEDAVPSSFSTDEFGLNVTYMPRFTEVSENYRVRSSEPKKEEPTPEEEAALDPTAEIGEDAEVERVVVAPAPSSTLEPTDESIKVYKFDTPTDTEDGEEKPDTAPEAPASEPAADEPVITIPVTEPPVEEKVLKKPEEYTIPDPETGKRSVRYEDAEEDLSSTADRRFVKKEFISPAQRDAFKDKLLDSLMAVRFRLASVIILFALMLGMEIARLFDVEPLQYLGLATHRSSLLAVDVMICIAMFALALPEVIRAVVALFKRVIAPELFTLISLGSLIAYATVVIPRGEFNTTRFGMLFGIQILATVTAGLKRTSANFAAFKIVSKNTHKHVLIKKLTRQLPRENIALDGAVDEYSSKTARMFRTAFVNDFFAHASKPLENNFNNLIIMGATVGIAAVTAVVSFFIHDNSYVYAMQSLVLVILVGCPAFSILVHKLPYLTAAKHAGGEEIAFVGEGALYEGADFDVIAYEDTEVFGREDVTISKVHLYGKVANTAKAMKQMYALFADVGGPLNLLFSAAVDSKGAVATDVVIEPNGVYGTVEGHTVAAGTEDFMAKMGISIPTDDYRTSRSANDSTRVMYGAEDGEVYVKFFIRYSFTEEFTMILPYLKEQGIVPLIYTRDPNVNNELLKILTMGDDVIRVMKKDGGKTTEEKTYRHLSSSIVTLSDRTTVVSIAQIARKYTAYQSNLAVNELISMIVGAALASLVAVGGMIDVTTAVGIIGGLAVWQTAWCIALSVRSRLAFKNPKK